MRIDWLWKFTLACVLMMLTGASAAAQSTQERDIDPRRVTPVVKVFRQTKGAVVNIASTRILELRQPFGGLGMFEDLFNLPGRVPRRRVERTSVGSGFVIHPAGYIITNAHVVMRTAERKAIFADGSEYEARIIATDARRDLALLKIDAKKTLQPIALGTSSDLMVGERVIAIGNPFGYENTVTTGVVSALKRTLEVSRDAELKNLIQTDASINPGNSGGPLLNILGELVGINTAIRADANNIGFAIPVDRLRALLPAMLDVERRYGFLTGLTVERIEQASNTPGCRISDVADNSPAARAGLETGDVVTRIDQQAIDSVIDFHIALIGRAPGNVVAVHTQGDDQPRRLTLAPRPEPDGGKLLREKFGIEAEPITPEIARRMGVPRLRGLRITGIELASPADRLQLAEGDVLLQVGRHQPTDMDRLGRLLEQVEPGDRVRLTVLRIEGRRIFRRTTAIEAR